AAPWPVVASAEPGSGEGAGASFSPPQAGGPPFHPGAEPRRLADPHARRILEAVRGKSKLTIVHAHGERLMFDRLATLPAHAWNWDDRRAGPPLRDSLSRVSGAGLGGGRPWGPPEGGGGRGGRAAGPGARRAGQRGGAVPGA